jgi:hypothetical protein
MYPSKREEEENRCYYKLTSFLRTISFFFFFGATAHILALAYLHETFRFTSVN